MTAPRQILCVPRRSRPTSISRTDPDRRRFRATDAPSGPRPAAMTAPRQILPGRFYLVSRRCTQRMFLLRPDEKTNEIFQYCLAEAATRFDIGLIAWVTMSNHYHAVLYDPHGRLPAFLEHAHKMIARCMNARWNRWENLWSTEQTCVTYLPTP